MQSIKISQSLIKDYDSYITEEVCGFEFESKYIHNTWNRTWNDSDQKALGRYFEFILTGGKPTGYDDFPEPKYMASALKKEPAKRTVEDMLAPYRLAHENATRVKDLLKKSGIEIISVQVYVENGIMCGNIDVIAMYKGREINIDIKYSGLIFDRWNKFGWMWSDNQMSYHGIQAKHYTALNGNPTYFLVISNTNNEDIKFFHADIDDETLQNHINRVNWLNDNIEMINEVGWNNYPSLKKCSNCPLADKCKDRITKLIPEKIYIKDID